MNIKRSIRNYKKGIRNSVVEQISVDFFIEKIEEAAKKFKYTPKYKNIREIIKELTNNGFSVIYYYNDLFRTGKYYIKECNLIIENMSIIYNGKESVAL